MEKGKEDQDWRHLFKPPWFSRMDTLTQEQRSKRMSLVKGRHTKPELAVRRLVHAMGYRYRLHDKRLPGCPDLVFRGQSKVIFVHGCFWHRHSAPGCRLARIPKSRHDFWLPKLSSNRERDMRDQAELERLGWQYLIVWECEIRHKEQVVNKVRAFLGLKR